MKKTKLGSKNPKYKKASDKKELVILKKVPLTGKAKGHSIFYKDELEIPTFEDTMNLVREQQMEDTSEPEFAKRKKK